MDLRHSGMGFPNGPVPLDSVFALPSPDILMLVTEARYHHDEAVRAGRRVLWRAIPNRGRRPAEVGWSPGRAVDEALNLTDTASEPIRDFVPWNELDLQDERGDHVDDWEDLEGRYALLGGFLHSSLTLLRQRLPGTRIHFPAFTPDHYALDYVDRWWAATEVADVVDFHGYDTLGKIQAQYSAYREAFQGKHLSLTEWHGLGDADEERRILTWLADTMATDPLFDAAYRFIWRWHDAASWWDRAYDVEGNPEMVALFTNPPIVSQEPPMPLLDPWEHFSAEKIAEATQCPVAAVREHWPRILGQLDLCGISDRPVQVAALGTVAIETASTFAPVREAFWMSEEWRAENLRYYPFYGRGHLQLTWEANYRAYGQKVDALWGAGGAIDLVARPDDALDPDISAAVLAVYFRDHGGDGAARIPQAARAGDWREVRRLVQGADAGLDRLVAIVAALEGQTVPTDIKLSDVLARGRSRIGDPYVWDGEQPGGFDCSGFVKYCYDGRLTSFTDSILGETVRVEKPAPGDIVLYEYKDAGQPGVRFPHVGLFLSDTLTLDARFGMGVGEHDQLPRTQARRFYRRAPNVIVDTVEAPPVQPPVDELAALRAEVDRLRTALGYSSVDIAAALQTEVDSIKASLGALEAAINTLKSQRVA